MNDGDGGNGGFPNDGDGGFPDEATTPAPVNR